MAFHPSPLPPPPTTLSPDNPRSLWNDILEVTNDHIDASTSDKVPNSLFQPTSFLNLGYGVLFKHIGQLHQSVYKHYLIIGLRIPTLEHMPHQPEEWYKGCAEDMPQIQKTYADDLFDNIFHNDYCTLNRFKTLYTEITKLLHSAIPALLPNQVVPFAGYDFLNISSDPMPTNPYGSNSTPRQKRSVPCHIADVPLAEIQRALDYHSKYGEPLPLDADTIYAEEHPTNTSFYPHLQNKRFLSALIRGIKSLFKGGNIFGKIVSGVKKIGGFIFKGIKGLFHCRKTTAFLNAIKAFVHNSRQFGINRMYKFRKFKGLHLGKVSLANTL